MNIESKNSILVLTIEKIEKNVQIINLLDSFFKSTNITSLFIKILKIQFCTQLYYLNPSIEHPLKALAQILSVLKTNLPHIIPSISRSKTPNFVLSTLWKKCKQKNHKKILKAYRQFKTLRDLYQNLKVDNQVCQQYKYLIIGASYSIVLQTYIFAMTSDFFLIIKRDQQQLQD